MPLVDPHDNGKIAKKISLVVIMINMIGDDPFQISRL
jgi:hypothetical protein